MSHPEMRAKLRVKSVLRHGEGDQAVESLTLGAVYKDSYADNPLDEDNTFARYTPQADLRMVIANPALHGKFAVGDTFYVDFTRVV